VIFQGFRRFLEAIVAMTRALEQLATIQRDIGPALERLEVLERARVHFEADCEGMLLKADGKLKAAASAEARERQLKKANERLADPFPENGDEAETAETLQRLHAATSETEGVQPVHLALATNDKAHAVRAKFGVA